MKKPTNEDGDFVVVSPSDDELTSNSGMVRHKFNSDANLNYITDENSPIVKRQPIRPIIKHNVGKSNPEGTESWLLPGECITHHIKKVGVVKNLPLTFFPQVQSHPQTIGNNLTQTPVTTTTNTSEYPSSELDFMNDFNTVYDLLGAVTGTNFGSVGSTTSTGGGNTGNEQNTSLSDTQPQLVLGELYITNYQIRFQVCFVNFVINKLLDSKTIPCTQHTNCLHSSNGTKVPSGL